MSNVRFTAWLSERERDAVHDAATRECSSDNYIVRLAIRAYLGLDGQPPLSRLSQVTNENNRERTNA